MKNLYYVALISIVALLAGCNVQERIVFNDDMGGRYESVIDLSQMMALGSQGRPQNAERKTDKLDTLVVFNEFLETFKDSISTLPAAQQKKLEGLKDFSMQMQMDEEQGMMVMTVHKDFKKFKDIERIAYDIENVFDSAKKTTPSGEQASNGPANSMMSMDKVIYTYSDNTFRRTDPKSLTQHLKDDGILSEETKQEIEENTSEVENPEDTMFSGMLEQMENELSNSKMTLEYVFPRKVISVSPEGSVISNDGKTVTFEVDWKTLLNDETKILENFEVVLEDK